MWAPLRTAEWRIDRAKFHAHALAEFWNSLDTQKAYSHRVEMQDDGTGKIFLTPVKRDWLVQFSVEIGEILYQLRSTLDSCVYDAAILKTGKNPPDKGRDLQFPICETPKKFKNCAAQIAPLADEVKVFIESVQPYRTAPPKEAEIARILGILNDWARIDRHRTLPVIGAFPSEVSGFLLLPPDMPLEWCIVENPRLLEDESHFSTFKVGGFRGDADIDVNLRIGMEIAVDRAEGIAGIAKAPAAMIAVAEEIAKEFRRLLKI